MLTGETFYVDRDEGLVWCDQCVPAQVTHVASKHDAGGMPPRAGRKASRFSEIASGELLLEHRDGQEKRPVRARCHQCGATQPPAGHRTGAGVA